MLGMPLPEQVMIGNRPFNFIFGDYAYIKSLEIYIPINAEYLLTNTFITS